MKKILGLIFLIVGILILITPFTPGSVILIIGLEMLLGHKIKWWTDFKKKTYSYIKWK